MKISRFKPKDSGYIRLEFSVTPEQIRIAENFDPDSLVIREEQATSPVFSLKPNDSNYVGNKGVKVKMPSQDSEAYRQPLTLILQFENEDEAALLGRLTNARKHISTIETRVKEAVNSYTAEKENIEEV